MTTENDALVKRLREMLADAGLLSKDGTYAQGATRDFEAVFDRLSAQGEPVAVKPLEWAGSNGRGGGFRYRIAEPSMTTGWRVWVSPDMGKMEVIGGGIVTTKAESHEAAITAAQADYEQRIRSALVAALTSGAGK